MRGVLRQGTARLRPRWCLMTVTLTLGALACGGDDPTATIGGVACDLDPDLLISSVARDAIPSLTLPAMVTPDAPGADYLVDTDRVLGVYLNGEARAYPHNILWYHEIVNDEISGAPVSITFCPLTGSGLAFQGEISGQSIELGVSGLVYGSNLVLFDRVSEDVIGPQLSVDGACGDFRGQTLQLLPVQEMSWGQWKALYPGTTVVTDELTFGRNYTQYPYGTYNEVTSNELLWPMGVDRTRQIKERVLAIRTGRGGRGYPYGELLALGDVASVNEVVGDVPTVVLFDGGDGQNALAFDARINGQTLTFDALSTGVWADRETGSTWAIDGSATAGPMLGERLQPRADAYTLFWFAWRLFQPDGQMFAAP